jgi:hypothetical protein
VRQSRVYPYIRIKGLYGSPPGGVKARAFGGQVKISPQEMAN